MDCPLIDITDELPASGDAASGMQIVNVSWYIDSGYFGRYPSVLIDYYSSNIKQTLFEVTRSGQLYIPSVPSDLRDFTFECRVWNNSASPGSQPHVLRPLQVVDYGKPIYKIIIIILCKQSII